MGTRYIAHSDMCGCERCAIQAERDNPQQVFDTIEDPDHEEEYGEFEALCDEDYEYVRRIERK